MAESAAAIQERVKEQRGQEAQANTRPIYRFTIPPTLANGVKEVGLVQLTSDEELRATKRSRNDTHRLAYELAKQSLVEVNGKTVSEGDGSSDTFWTTVEPKMRMLVVSAYGELHAPEQDELDAFLKSQKVVVG